MSDFDWVALSKTVSHALRHEPWLYELELDDEGWAALDSVLAALRDDRPAWAGVVESDLAQMIAVSAKQRFEIRDARIRALYGHSLPGQLRKTPAAPPDVLFHGTAPAALPAIRAGGLLPMGRQYVHLSVDSATAAEVGRRKARRPVILRIRAGDAQRQGLPFYAGNAKVWLADCVPAEYIDFDG